MQAYIADSDFSFSKEVALSVLTGMFPELKNFVNKKEKTTLVSLSLSRKELPILSFTKNLASVRTPFQMHIKNPMHSEQDILVMNGVVDFTMTLKMSKKKTLLYGEIEGLEVTITELRPYFKTNTKMEDVQNQIEVLKGTLKTLLQDKAKSGILLDIPSDLKKEFADYEV